MGSEEPRDGEQSSPETAVQVPGTPHVLIFPFPIQGHITPMLKLAELLSLSGMRVTFLCTPYNQRRLLSSSRVPDRLARRPGLRLRSVPDGLPDDNPRDGSRLLEMVAGLEAAAPPLFRELLASAGGGGGADAAPPVTCVVADGLIGFVVDVAEEMGVPIIGFRTSSACSFWAYQHIPELQERGIIPFRDGCDMDELVACVPGMESFLRRRDLPSFCRATTGDDPSLRFLMGVIRNATRCRGLVLNTAEFVEFSVLTQIRRLVPSTYPVGPLHGLLQTVESFAGAVEDGEADGVGSAKYNSTSLWPEERTTCTEWLDARPPASVVYVSFGSVALLRREQLLELWRGLVDSGYHFLWALRPGLVADGGGGGVPEEVAAGTEERGLLVGWAPQQEVLAHPAVGCFLTHSGWNSTLESVWAGVPMVCLPYFADQNVNSRFVGEVWRNGVDIKDRCDRDAVEEAVREVMAGERGPEMRAAAARLSQMARECVGEGGSSAAALERLIRDIRAMGRKRE